MNRPDLDPETAERMLRGEATGPPELAALLAAAAAPSERDPAGEEAAVAAFRRAAGGATTRRRFPALLGLKTAVAGIVLLLAGGVAVAATGNHLSGPVDVHPSGETGAPTASYPAVRPRPRTTTPHPTPKPEPRRHAKTPSAKKSGNNPPGQKKQKDQVHPSVRPTTPNGRATKPGNGPPDKIKVKVQPDGV